MVAETADYAQGVLIGKHAAVSHGAVLPDIVVAVSLS